MKEDFFANHPFSGVDLGRGCVTLILLTMRRDVIMRRPIEDEFKDLPISRQRKYQLRMLRDGRCTECGEPVVLGSRCLKHLVLARERQRQKKGLKRRYWRTLSYRLEKKMSPHPGRLPFGRGEGESAAA